jgi:hypothetical protein
MIDPAWMHGWSAIVAAYTAVQAPMIAGLARVRANFITTCCRRWWRRRWRRWLRRAPLFAAP